MTATLTETLGDHLRRTILREVDAGNIDLDRCDGPLLEEITRLAFANPMLVSVRKERLVLTDAGREYLNAVDPR